MERLISGPLAEALEQNRERFNSKFAYARSINRRLDPEEFGRHLSDTVAPLVEAVAEIDPGAINAAAEALFDASLDLVGREYLGPSSKTPVVDLAWKKVLPKLAGPLAKAPHRLVAAISNAAFNIDSQPTADAKAWLALVLKTAPLAADVEELLKAGQVAAWRCGLAHFRESALEVWSELPEELAYAALNLDPPPKSPPREALYQALAADPWLPPHQAGLSDDQKLRLVAHVGGFQGFGGPFTSPPEVIAAHDTLYAFDSRYCWSIHADLFGAVLLRYGPDIPEGAGEGNSDFRINADGGVTHGQYKAQFPSFKNRISAAAVGSALAVTLPRSHKVFLVALTAA